MNTTANTIVEKFTPGPWRVGEVIEGREAIFNNDGAAAISVMATDTMEHYDQKANAKLIAAAPDLYAACIEFCRKFEAGEARSTESYVQMKAAIQKATE